MDGDLNPAVNTRHKTKPMTLAWDHFLFITRVVDPWLSLSFESLLNDENKFALLGGQASLY